MRKYLFLLIILISFATCQRKKNIENNFINIKNEINNHSFVISCGSGCALTYNFKDTLRVGKDIIVEYKVYQFINEEIIDTFYEKYRYNIVNNNTLIYNEVGEKITFEKNGNLYVSLFETSNYFELKNN